MPEHSHAFVAIFDGVCQAVAVDARDDDTAKFVTKMIREGGTVEWVPIAIAREALFEPWPRAGG